MMPPTIQIMAMQLFAAQRTIQQMSSAERRTRWGDYADSFFNHPLSKAEYRALTEVISVEPLGAGAPDNKVIQQIQQIQLATTMLGTCMRKPYSNADLATVHLTLLDVLRALAAGSPSAPKGTTP